MYTVTYVDADRELRDAQADISIAEGHGCLCGALCTLEQFTAAGWLQELLPDAEVVPTASVAVNATLQQLFADTQRALRSDEMEFMPLLPDDDQPLATRILTMAQWAHGFLYGFGIGITGTPEDMSADVTEVLRDLAEIARADDAELTGSEQEEEAYMELVEYLRAAVQLLHDELAPQRVAQAARPAAH